MQLWALTHTQQDDRKFSLLFMSNETSSFDDLTLLKVAAALRLDNFSPHDELVATKVINVEYSKVAPFIPIVEV